MFGNDKKATKDSADVDGFLKQIKDQLLYGATKYKADESGRESTDIICSVYGTNWVLGTISKYLRRITNLNRERDAFKIASYYYLIWCKRGFWVRDGGINDPVLDSNIEVKLKNFDMFADKIKATQKQFNKDRGITKLNNDTLISLQEKQLAEWATKDFRAIEETPLIHSFILIMNYWLIYPFENKGTDSDTWNENKKS